MKMSAQEFEAWFKAEVAAGRPPDALRRDVGPPEERFWAMIIDGLDGHLYWDGPLYRGRPWLTRATAYGSGQYAQRFAWNLRHDHLPRNLRVWSTCGVRDCLSADHLESGHWSRIRRFTEEACIGALQTAALRLGHPPTVAEYEALRRSSGSPGASTIMARMGLWVDALRAAGCDAEPRPRYTDQEMLDALRAFGREHGRAPSQSEWQSSGRKPSRGAICDRLGWVKALKRAGLR